MTKSSGIVAPLASEKGQISIFFSASLIVLITIVAFVINIGLFVKAKINLQNATDAAAFAGASVQSRQLTTIAYLNWEMRNIYKEWMFKYYVVGNLNIEDVENPAAATNPVSYRLRPTTNVLETDPARRFMRDPFNFPSVCIHLAGSETNLCKRYSVPGLPEFGSSNLPGAEEASRAFVNTLIATKVLDCVDQTRLNMLVNLTWAYNVLARPDDETIVEQGPQILADRLGSWPKALEVAMRIRNLELAVNRRPESSGVCSQKNQRSDIRCGRTISEISGERFLGNERIVKAFYSGYRNLGNEIESEMKETFTLTEIPPKIPDLGSDKSASYLLIPKNRAGQAGEKPYLDLHLMMVNYATFYNAFVPRASNNGAVPVSGACDVSKVAMPVPGYPMGFYKNSDVLTYYAVKGEAEFVGMFNPFGDDAIRLTTYSAAKPFGGRIGPMLFLQKPSTDFFVGRTDPNKKRSVPYIATLDFVGSKNLQTLAPLQIGQFAPGTPLPINFPDDYFWLRDADSPIGGFLPGDDVHFGLPNLVYDYEQNFSNSTYTTAGTNLNTLTFPDDDSADQAVGLFSKYQLQQFKGTALNTEVSQTLLDREISRIKAPTLYDAANYLVPTPEALNQTFSPTIDSVGFIPGQKRDIGGGLEAYQAEIYAPLHSSTQDDVYWKNGPDVVATITEFLSQQESGIKKYKRNMIKAAFTIEGQGANLASEASGARSGFTRAAKGVADVDFTLGENQNIGSCASLAGVFIEFFFGAIDPSMVINKAGCPQSLQVNLEKYFGTDVPGFSPSHYQMNYTYNPQIQRGRNVLYSAYLPGPVTGVSLTGILSPAISGSFEPETTRRNFYSTKFVQLRSLVPGGPWAEATSGFASYSEGSVLLGGPDVKQKNWQNPLDTQAVPFDVNAIRY